MNWSSRRWGTLVAAVIIALLATPAFGQHSETPTKDRKIKDYVASMQYLSGITEDSSEPPKPIDPLIECMVSPDRANATWDDIAAFNPNAGVLWPGALIQGDSIASGVLAPINPPRTPLTITFETVNPTIDGKPIKTDFQVENPSAATIEQKRQIFLGQPFNSPAKFSYSVEQMFSAEQSMLELKGKASWLQTSIEAYTRSATNVTRTNMAVKFVQEYYTISAEAPSTPISYLGRSTSLATHLEPYSDPKNNPITYVSSVTYGRMAILLISSSSSSSELQQALDAAFSAIGGSSRVQVTNAQKSMINQSDLQLIVLGGDPKPAAKILTGDKLTALAQYIESGALASNSSPAIPISYRLNYLNDNQPVSLSMATEFKRVQDCHKPYVRTLMVTFNTTSDDKDPDSFLVVEVLAPGNKKLASYSQNGLDYFGNGTTKKKALSLMGNVRVDDFKDAAIRICMTPTGKDRWDFTFSVSGESFDGRVLDYNHGHEYLESKNVQTCLNPNKALPPFR